MAKIVARKKVAILLFGSSILPDLGIRTKNPKRQVLDTWAKRHAELQVLANVDVQFVPTEGPVTSAENWVRLGSVLRSGLRRYDGFVVIHDLETMAYTGSMLAMMFRGLGKPVVLTASGANLVSKVAVKLDSFLDQFGQLGYKVHLLNAIQTATLDVSGVLIMFGNRLLKAVRAVRSDDVSTNFFDALGDEYVGSLTLGVRLLPTAPKRNSTLPAIKVAADDRVQLIDLQPGVDLHTFERMDLQRAHGFVVRYADLGTLLRFLSMLDSRIDGSVPVVIYSRGVSSPPVSGPNRVFINRMSMEVTLVKLMWGLGAKLPLAKLRTFMLADQAGEVVSPT
ncbi:MAG: asparaginase domain-containing protein [Patescibacteria group bacterium]